jgi:hypothetical protein
MPYRKSIMFDHPTAAELIAAARMHLEQHVIPAIGEPQLRFQTLVAANVLAIAERELAGAEPALGQAWQRQALLGVAGTPMPAGSALRDAVGEQNQALCQAIRCGEFDADERQAQLLDHLRATAEHELAVANPRYLARVRQSAP